MHMVTYIWVNIGSGCCLAVPSHYQCWLLITEVLWHSPEGNFTGNAQDTCISPQNELKNYQFKFTATSPRGHWFKELISCTHTSSCRSRSGDRTSGRQMWLWNGGVFSFFNWRFSELIWPDSSAKLSNTLGLHHKYKGMNGMQRESNTYIHYGLIDTYINRLCARLWYLQSIIVLASHPCTRVLSGQLS